MKRDLNRKLRHFGKQNAMDALESAGTDPDSTNVMSTKEQLQEIIYNDCDNVYKFYQDAVRIQSQIQQLIDQNSSRLEELNALTKDIDGVDESIYTVSQSEKSRFTRLRNTFFLLPLFDTLLVSLGLWPIMSHHLRNFVIIAIIITLGFSAAFAYMHRFILNVIDTKEAMSPSRKTIFTVLLSLCILLVPGLYLISWQVFASDEIYCITMACTSLVIQLVSTFVYVPYIKVKDQINEKREIKDSLTEAKKEEKALENAIKATAVRIQELPYECVRLVNGSLRQAFIQLRKDYSKYQDLFNEEPDLDIPATTLFFCQAYYLQRIEMPIPKIEALLTIDDLTSLSASFTLAHQELRIPQNLMADLQSALDAPATSATQSSAIAPPSTPVTGPTSSSVPEPIPTTPPDDTLPNIVDLTDDVDDDDFDPFHY